MSDAEHDRLIEILVGLNGLVSASGGRAIVENLARIDFAVMTRIDTLSGDEFVTREIVEQALKETESAVRQKVV